MAPTPEPLRRLAVFSRTTATIVVGAAAVAGVVLVVMRWRRWSWSWGGVWLMPGLIVWGAQLPVGWRIELGYCVLVFVLLFGGFRWHRRDLRAGGDFARRAATEHGLRHPARVAALRRELATDRLISRDGAVVGVSRDHRVVRVPLGGAMACHVLGLGATGSGKTFTASGIARRVIAGGGFGFIGIDPKGDRFLHEQVERAAAEGGRRFVEWTPEGGLVYNPYARGTATEIADKLLAGETYTEPHYLRLAQRYLGQAVRAIQSSGLTPSLSLIVEYMLPERLEQLARTLPEQDALGLHRYLDTLTAQQHRDLAGTRDRLAILAEGDVAPWLDPRTRAEQIDLPDSL